MSTVGITILKQKDLKPTNLVDFEDIAKHCKINVMLYKPKKDSGKDQGTI